MRQSLLVPYFFSLPTPFLSFSLSLYSFSCRTPRLPFAVLWKSQWTDASSYQSAESVNRWSNVFQPATLPQCYRRNARARFSWSISYSSCTQCLPFCLPSRSPCSVGIFMGSDSPRALVGELKFNEDWRVKPISDYFFQFNPVSCNSCYITRGTYEVILLVIASMFY